MKVLIREKLSKNKMLTPEGYLICVDSVLARTGKQSYTRDEVYNDSNFETVEIDRTADEVFSNEAIASFENKPITVEHPKEQVNANNNRRYSVGFVRDVKRGNDAGKEVLLGSLVITDKDAIDDVQSGKRTDLSCGYDCDITDDDNPRQVNIRGNHVALCVSGRAGNARIVDTDTFDMTRNMERLAENTYVKLKAEYDALDAEIDRNDNNPNYDLASASTKLQKIYMEITNMRKKFPFLTDGVSPENVTIEVKDGSPVKIDKVAYKQGAFSVLEATSQHGKIYLVVKNYNGENPYSGGGTVTFDINEAKHIIESYETIDKLKSKYGEGEGYRRWMAGKKDSIDVVDMNADAIEINVSELGVKRIGKGDTVTYKGKQYTVFQTLGNYAALVSVDGKERIIAKITDSSTDFDFGYRDGKAGFFDKWYRYNRNDDGKEYERGIKKAISEGATIKNYISGSGNDSRTVDSDWVAGFKLPDGSTKNEMFEAYDKNRAREWAENLAKRNGWKFIALQTYRESIGDSTNIYMVRLNADKWPANEVGHIIHVRAKSEDEAKRKAERYYDTTYKIAERMKSRREYKGQPKFHAVEAREENDADKKDVLIIDNMPYKRYEVSKEIDGNTHVYIVHASSMRDAINKVTRVLSSNDADAH